MCACLIGGTSESCEAALMHVLKSNRQGKDRFARMSWLSCGKRRRRSSSICFSCWGPATALFQKHGLELLAAVQDITQHWLECSSRHISCSTGLYMSHGQVPAPILARYGVSRHRWWMLLLLEITKFPGLQRTQPVGPVLPDIWNKRCNFIGVITCFASFLYTLPRASHTKPPFENF